MNESNKVEMCDKCKKRPAMHECYRWWVDPPREALCCQCNAKDETSDPADWHMGCVAAWNREERKRNSRENCGRKETKDVDNV